MMIRSRCLIPADTGIHAETAVFARFMTEGA
jgi:hypothetical protein